ncbi:hypothetical protein HNP38_000644 [Chryseobacterium defluvii]|uniref:DUF6705 domain-containing protein n=1 Tax=Chryseobacterium defluvii TaxID=160396 RepID=A0A840KEJ8_9FLAO|nr:DUF6705 family protein [Chryseobacterium defluvii]MBB4805372.1 hypothetical protein [Chryseobacterium defluvii]
MKPVLSLIILFLCICCKSQIYPLKTYDIEEFPKDSYVKDTNNELHDYEGTWKGTWNGKTILITLKKIKFYKIFLENRAYYNDILIGKFIVKDSNGLILFDNNALADDNAKIKGSGFIKNTTSYLFGYNDPDLCHMNGRGRFKFTDSTKTKLEWKYSESENWIDTDCFYYGWAQADRPQPLPNTIILTKQ